MFINKKTGTSYGFVAPEIEADNGKDVKVQFPTFGTQIAEVESNEASVTVERTTTLVEVGEEKLTAATTLTATPGDKLPAGARLMVKWINGETKYDVSLKKDADTTCAKLAGVANATVCYELVWTGSTWQLLK